MFPPMYTKALASPAVVALLGNGAGAIRFYAYGLAPLKPPPKLPYATWQSAGGGVPFNTLADRPDGDLWSLQVDVWGLTSAQVEAVTIALRDSFEDDAYVVRWGDQKRDALTLAFGYDFDVDWHHHR